MSREYQILTELKGSSKCIELFDTFYTIGDDSKLTQNFVLELFPDSLEALILNSRETGKHIPFVRIQRIMKQIFEALKFVHDKEICHRDVKPENILLDENDNVKLCDFGSSKKLTQDSNIKHFPHVVSRYYRAPELSLCHTDYTNKIDIWAAGCVFVELFTLEVLFPGKTEGSQLLEIMAIMGPPKKVDQKYLYNAISPDTQQMLEKVSGMQKIELSEVFPKENYKSNEISLAVSLAKKLLQWNPDKRFTASQALDHKFFKA